MGITTKIDFADTKTLAFWIVIVGLSPGLLRTLKGRTELR